MAQERNWKKKGRGVGIISVCMQRVCRGYTEVYIVFVHKRCCDGLSVESLLCGSLAFCESVVSDLCQHEADPQCLGPSESAVQEAKRTGVIRKNTIK